MTEKHVRLAPLKAIINMAAVLFYKVKGKNEFGKKKSYLLFESYVTQQKHIFLEFNENYEAGLITINCAL